jgi:hypothetical protein
VTKRLLILALLAAVMAGCGGASSGSPVIPTILPAKSYGLAEFQPSKPVKAGVPVTISFKIEQPNGQALTALKTCCEPHEGVDLIIVRGDDSHVQYDDSDADPDGTISQPVVFPAPGRYRIVIDVYPKQSGQNSVFNFQLFTWVTVSGSYHPQPVPAYAAATTVDGYRFQIQGHPHLKAIEANFLTIHVSDPDGSKTVFTTWRGAYAHAIFFRARSLDYFHSHVCGPHSAYCFSVLGSARVTGHSYAPGVLKVGVLLPAPGRWRMFLITYLNGHIVTVPFTLEVR